MNKKSQWFMLIGLYFWIVIIVILLINFGRSECVPKTSGLTVVNGKSVDDKVNFRVNCLDGLGLKAKNWFIIGGVSLLYCLWTFRPTKHN